MSGVRIKCDAPGCEALFPPAPVRGGYKALSQRATIKDEATAAGWSFSEDGDFCPAHAK